MKASQDECVYEACMCSNSVLVYGSYTPNQAVLGFEPQDTYTIDDDALCKYKDARSTKPDAIETAVRMRLLAKDAIIQSVIEHRISESANSKVQQYTPEQISQLKPGTRVDIFREPESKEISGWKGPADLLHLDPSNNKAIVQWRGHPMGLPLRHVRPHVGFVWLLDTHFEGDDSMMELVSGLMNSIEDHAIGQVFTYGHLWNNEQQSFITVPDNLHEQPPKTYSMALQVASSVLNFTPIEGVQFGTGCKATEPLVNIPYGRLVVWNKNNRPGYRVTSVEPSKRYTLASRGSYTDLSFFLVYNLGGEQADEDKRIDVPVDDLDISDAWSPSTIPWIPIDQDVDSPWLPAPMPPPTGPGMPPASGEATSLPVPVPSLIPTLPPERPSPHDGVSGEPISVDDETMPFEEEDLPEEPTPLIAPPSNPPPSPPKQPKAKRDQIEAPLSDRSRSRDFGHPSTAKAASPVASTITIPVHEPSQDDLDRSRTRDYGNNDNASPLPRTLDFSPEQQRGETRPLDITTDVAPPMKKPTLDDSPPQASSSQAASSSEPILPIAEGVTSDADRIDSSRSVVVLRDDNARDLSNPSAPPVNDSSIPDVSSADSDETVEYENEHFTAVPQGWTKFCAMASKQTHHGHLYEHSDDEFLVHAMYDARRVLDASQTNNLPWSVHDALFVMPGPWSESKCFYVDIFNGDCFPVTESDLLTEREVAENFMAVEAADRKEIGSFIQHDVFRVDITSNSTNTVDAVWVRRWIDRNKKIIK